MNNRELEQVWSSVVNIVKTYENIDATQIDAFFNRLTPQAFSDGFFVLSADNNFIKTWVEKNYLPLISRAFQDIYSKAFNVIVELDDTPQATLDNVSSPWQTASLPSNNIAHEQNTESDSSYNLSLNSTSSVKNENDPLLSFTFENFVIGDSNRMSYSMAVAVAEMPGKAHLNPLFIYGKSGLGKTHLLRAIQNYIHENIPSLNVVYADSAELLSDYTDASIAHDKDKTSYRNFKARYEEADVILIDDIQYLQDKPQTLNIIFQIFNKLVDSGRQVVLSADRAPKNIDIDERYISRFNSGATFDIQPPEIETKVGIIKNYINDYKISENLPNLSVPENIQLYIAENSGSNIRELKSAVNKVIYQIEFFKSKELSVKEVKTLLEDHFTGGPSRKITIENIQEQVASFYKISVADLSGNSRTRGVSYPRHVALYLCRQFLDLPFSTIGKSFNRDHSTVMSAVTSIEGKLKTNRDVVEEIEMLRRRILEM